MIPTKCVTPYFGTNWTSWTNRNDVGLVVEKSDTARTCAARRPTESKWELDESDWTNRSNVHLVDESNPQLLLGWSGMADE